MKHVTMWTKVMALFLVFSLVTTAVYGAPAPLKSASNDFTPAKSINANDKVTLIVETGLPAVLSDEMTLMDESYEEAYMLEKQTEIANAIEDKTGAALIPGQQYTMLLNGFAVEASGGDIDVIKSISGVKNVYICNEIQFEPHLMDSVGAVSAMPENTGGYTGKGQIVAIIDDEFDVSHPFFSQVPPDLKYTREDIENIVNTNGIDVDAAMVYVNEKIPFAYNYADSSYNLLSANLSHGTHVAGIAAGNTTEVNNVKGVAHNSQLALMRVASEDGKISDASVIKALEDAAKLGVCAINFSVGADYASTYSMPLIEQCFNNIRNAGIFVSSSAGNKGRGYHQNKVLAQNVDYSSIGGVSSFNSTFSVGAVNKPTQNTVSVAYYSGYGVSEDLILNPDISAPGSYIYSSLSGGSYGKMSGTSMASPHVVGAYAAACEYFEEKFPHISGKERLELVERQFMSTAVPVRSETSVYTPRVQGAGVLNVASAIETPVVLRGEGTKSKINLGSDIGDNFTLNFKAENISGSDAEYDSISMELISDDYTFENGQYIVAGTRVLEASHNLPEKVVISSGEEVEITADVCVDSAATADLSKVFTNGFFIEGFVYMKKSDGSLPDLSIPFMGFYGDWTKAPIFDTTVYDEYGSALNDATVGGASLLYTTEQGYALVLGSNGNGGYDSKYNAISPNGDSLQDVLNFQFTPLRTLKLNNAQIVTSDGVLCSNTYFGGTLFNKFFTRSMSFENVRNLDDGDYRIRVSGVYNYPAGNPQEQIVTVPFYIDTQMPQITSATRQGNKVSVNVKDNRYISHAYTYYLDAYGNVNSKRVYIPNPEEGELYNLEFDLADIGAEEASMEDVYVFVHDMAGNYYVNSVAQLSGNVYITVREARYEDKSIVMRISMKKFSGPDQEYDMLIAFYDEYGKLIAFKSARNIKLSVEYNSSYGFSMDADLDNARRCTVFMWDDLGELAPLDTTKDIDISNIIPQ